MDADGADLPGVVEPDELPRLAAVGRLVDAAAGGHVAAHAVGAGADVDHVRIRIGDGDRAHRSDRNLAVGDRRPGRAAVGRPEQAAAGDAHVERLRLRRHAGDRRDASAARRTDEPILHPLEERRIDDADHRCSSRLRPGVMPAPDSGHASPRTQGRRGQISRGRCSGAWRSPGGASQVISTVRTDGTGSPTSSQLLHARNAACVRR